MHSVLNKGEDEPSVVVTDKDVNDPTSVHFATSEPVPVEVDHQSEADIQA